MIVEAIVVAVLSIQHCMSVIAALRRLVEDEAFREQDKPLWWNS